MTNSTRKRRLRIGFSTGTAMTAAARAALRLLVTGTHLRSVAVRLSVGYYLAVDVLETEITGRGQATASVVKDAGDDPDVTDKAEIRVTCTVLDRSASDDAELSGGGPVVWLQAGRGVGRVTKAGLPVPVGEPAVNPGPRAMLKENLLEELSLHDAGVHGDHGTGSWCTTLEATTFAQAASGDYLSGDEANTRAISPRRYPFHRESAVRLHLGHVPGRPDLDDLGLLIEVQVPKGEELARHTLNPRLGIIGGISILGVTGLVKPFSNEAYEETIQTALSVALANRCDRVVLSTGGRSERFAQGMLPELREDCFIQIADFFAFAVRECAAHNVRSIVHSVFFGKALKMARGHEYTHAHRVPLDLALLSRMAVDAGHGESFAQELSSANTARHACEIIRDRDAMDLFRTVALQAASESSRFGSGRLPVRLLLFDYDGQLIADVETA